ncbi:MAG TPA: diphthine--ammonia ligase [Candidatus Saccharimonadales bacterium]|nr:diphthine--ammonia ligase [Candidatus Saccharimonadales bacterium]
MSNACLFSGGKDSTLSLHKAVESGVKIDLIITMLPENKESYMFHYPNLKFTSLQAEAMGIKQVFVKTQGKKEDELADLEMAFRDNDVRFLVTGATYSKYQADRIGNIATRLGIENMAPLWHIEPLRELNELSEKYEAIIAAVAAEGFDDSFLGKRIDQEMIAKLVELNKRYNINMLFEGGEAESFVLNAPLFRKRIRINRARKEWNGARGLYMIEDAELVGK